jgi:hypothetical protein
MSNPKIATSAEQPINRHAAVSAEELTEGVPVGLNASGHLVAADADGGNRAVGICFGESVDPANYTAEIMQSMVEANRSLVGEHRISFVRYGIEVENDEQTWGFTPGEEVYLDAGGGYTQDDTAGTMTQRVGVALEAERIVLSVE